MLAEVVRFSKWLRRRSPHATTVVHYTNDLELFFAWGDKPCEAITLHDIDAYIEHAQALGHAVATINRRLAAIRAFYAFLSLESDTPPANPVLPKRHFIRQGRRLPRDVEDAVITRLFAVITVSRDRAMFLLMLRCGLRVGEVRSLTLSDLYLQPSAGQLPRLWVSGKGDTRRVVYLSAQAESALRAWLDARPVAESQAIFLNRFGRELTITGIQERLAHYCREVEVWITCHQLRHTFARHLVEAGMPITSIQKLLGHARLRTTQVYLHISDPQVQADYQAAMAYLAQRFAVEGSVQ